MLAGFSPRFEPERARSCFVVVESHSFSVEIVDWWKKQQSRRRLPLTSLDSLFGWNKDCYQSIMGEDYAQLRDRYHVFLEQEVCRWGSVFGRKFATITNFAPLLSTLGSMNEWMNDWRLIGRQIYRVWDWRTVLPQPWMIFAIIIVSNQLRLQDARVWSLPWRKSGHKTLRCPCDYSVIPFAICEL